MPDRVFIDANIFIGDGRPPGKNIVRAMRNLVQSGKLVVLTTDITINEITKHFYAHDMKIAGHTFKPRSLQLIHEVTKVDLPESDHGEIQKRIWAHNEQGTRLMLKSLDAVILNVDNIAPSSVFIDYATGKGLFEEGIKKDQFPDAFIAKILEADVDENGPITILSKDGDFAQVSDNSDTISLLESVSDLLEKLDLAVSDGELETFLSYHTEDILKLALPEIQDFFIHIDDQPEAEGEVISVDQIKILGINDFEINEEETFISGTVLVHATISYSGPDMATAIWDSEDKRAYAFSDIEGETDQEFSFEFTMTVLNDDNGVPDSIADMNFVNDGPLWFSLDNVLDY